MPRYKFIGTDEHNKVRVVLYIKAKDLDEARSKGLELYKEKTKRNPAEIQISRLTKTEVEK